MEAHFRVGHRTKAISFASTPPANKAGIQRAFSRLFILSLQASWSTEPNEEDAKWDGVASTGLPRGAACS